MKTKKAISLILALFIVWAALPIQSAFASGTRYYVKQGGTGAGTGGWHSASPDLKGIMDGAIANDEIWVAAGTYKPGVNETDTFLLKAGVKVYGGFAGTEDALSQRNLNNVNNKTTLSGKIDESKNVYHVVTGGTDATPDDTRLDGFTITGGNANGTVFYTYSYGGGMYNVNSSPTVENCSFSGNTANSHGGGMYNESSSPTVENCAFSGNTTKDSGGGMYNFDNSSPTVENCSFSGNTAKYQGGGMVNFESSATVRNCTFSGNMTTDDSGAEGRGGGMVNQHSSTTVENCTFSGNSANYAGGIYNTGNSSTTVTKCAFSGNTANSHGGGMYNNNSSPAVENCAFSSNTAWIGGGMYNSDSSLTVTNCTLSDNTAENGGGGMYNSNSSLTVTNCTFSNNTTAMWYGGGMHNYNSSPILVNTILWGNTAPNDCGPDIYQNEGTLNLKNCVVGEYNLSSNADKNISNLITGDPKLKALNKAGGNPDTAADVYIYKLQTGSSAIDAGLIGNGVTVPGKDQRDITRPQGAGVDIGSYEAEYTITSVEVNPDTASVEKGKTQSFTANVTCTDDYNNTVTWSVIGNTSSGTTISDSGTLAVAADENATALTVKATSKGDSTKSGTATVTVEEAVVAVTGVTVDPETLTLTAGGATETLSATVLPDDATNKDVTWASNNEAVATVANGAVTPIAAGQAIITVKTVDGNKTATCTVTVQSAGINYTTVSGDGQTHTRSSGEDLLLTVKRNTDDNKTFGLFRELRKDGAPVSKSYYTAQEGSLIIRLKSAWLDTLSAGLHTLSIIFEDGEAKASFTIKAKAGSFEDVTVPKDSFTFTKLWQGGHEKSIDWTLYDEMDQVAHKLFNKKVVSQTEWKYEAWFDKPVSRYVVEKPVAGYSTRYKNVGVYAGITDRCCNGGTIINHKIPQTGDEANPALWIGLLLLGITGIGIVLMAERRRKTRK